MSAQAGLPAEIALLERLAAGFAHSPLQLNQRHQSDAELIRLPGTRTLLALTTDAISEEIESGLYADAHLIGWMAVLVNASDLAAVGASPVGILLNQTLPHGIAEDRLEQLQQGLADASRACGLPVLGGDTNFGSRLHMGASAVGMIEDGIPLTRRGARPGDRLFSSGPLGLGGAFALARMTQPDGDPPAFQPQPRFREAALLRRYATCCMDTSDGAIATLDELARLNGTGFVLTPVVSELLHPVALAVAGEAGIPPWFMLAGPHGEFELLFTIPDGKVARFAADARDLGWRPLEMGMVGSGPEVVIRLEHGPALLDTRAVRDAFGEAGGDPRTYQARLSMLHQAMTATTVRHA